MLKKFVLITSCFFLYACGDSKKYEAYDAPGYVDGKPVHPSIKIGKPYQVKGQKYYPKYEPEYQEEGMASWYGPDFHGKKTANGERYNQYAMTGAHRTLPMPSIVEVKHMKTGKTIIVRINDRGPFSSERIIDLSQGAAEALGIIGEGVAPVRVRYLGPETESYIAKLQLEKPEEWLAHDEQRSGEVLVADASPFESVGVSELPPLQSAQTLPEPAPVNTETTVHARGVEVKEIGYSEDAFSVLQQEVYEPVRQADNLCTMAAQDNALHQVQEARSGSNIAADPSNPQVALSRDSPPVATPAGYFVQVGSFSNEGNARALAEKLSALSAVDVNQQNSLYRVRLGPTADPAIAEELQGRMGEFGIHDARIIKEQ